MLLPVVVIAGREHDAKASALAAARVSPIVLLVDVESLGVVNLGDRRRAEGNWK